MNHIVFFSSGIGSWAAAKIVAKSMQLNDFLILLFADVGIEDLDNYRFLEEAAANVGGKLVVVKSSKYRDVFDCWQRNKAIPNNMMPFCSRELKQKVCRDWLERYPPSERTTLYLGISWDEIHRIEAIKRGWSPHTVRFPLTEPPYYSKDQLLGWAKKEGLKPPRLYDLGFPHANCGGGCVRAGQAHFRHLLKMLPDVFARWEQEENNMRKRTKKNIAILKKQTNGKTRPYPLSQLRSDIEAENEGQLDLLDWGGCGCFLDDAA